MSRVSKVICIGCCLATILTVSSMLQEVVQLKVVPQSQNVVAGEIVEFSCVFPRDQYYTAYYLTVTPTAGSSVNETCLKLSNDDVRCTTTFTAGVEHNGAIISCYALRGIVTIPPNISNDARLEVQEVAPVNGAGIKNASNVTIPATCVDIISPTVNNQPTVATSTTPMSTPEVTSTSPEVTSTPSTPKEDNTMTLVLVGVIIPVTMIIIAAIILSVVLSIILSVVRRNRVKGSKK